MIFKLERFFFQHLNLILFLGGLAEKFPLAFQNRNSNNYYLNQY